jgi:hypothetical protein
MRLVLVATLLLLASSAPAKAPSGQRRACDAKTKCEAGLQCLPSADGKSRCEIACSNNAQCPEEQRCVKDGPSTVCRAVNIGMPGL